MKRPTIDRHLRKLRRECIDGSTDPVLKRIAMAMEIAIQRVTLDVRGWPDLAEQARIDANYLRSDLAVEERQLAEAQAHGEAGWKAYRDRTEQEQSMESNAKAAWDRVAELEMERDAAVAALPTDQPNDPSGRLLLNAYGRRCYEAALAAATQERKWHPIETAPTDGTPIRLRWEGTTVEATGRWAADKNHRLSNWRDVEGGDSLTLPTHWDALASPARTEPEP